MSQAERLLIIGAGHAGVAAAAALREFGCREQVVVVGAEPHEPYERPPLSKAGLVDPVAAAVGLALPGLHADNGIELRLALSVCAIDTEASIALLSNGESLPFTRCLIATGGTARNLPGLASAHPRVHSLRSFDDALALRQVLHGSEPLTIIGAGFLGLEVASSARQLGLEVTVVETASRVLARVLPPVLSDWIAARARSAGVDLSLGVKISQFHASETHVTIDLADGQSIRAAQVLVAIGQLPDTALARSAGLEISARNGGIAVDANWRTSAPRIYAAGDCASRTDPNTGEELRLESWHNAMQSARAAAAAMLGLPTPSVPVPWFWTDVFGCNLQMLGLPAPDLQFVARGAAQADAAQPKFMLLGLHGQRLCQGFAVNAGGDLRQLRALIESGRDCDTQRLLDPARPLRDLVRAAHGPLPASNPVH